MAEHRQTPTSDYAKLLERCKAEHVVCHLSFEEFWCLWSASGVWGRPGYSIERYDETKPFARGNAYIKAHPGEVRESWRGIDPSEQKFPPVSVLPPLKLADNHDVLADAYHHEKQLGGDDD